MTQFKEEALFLIDNKFVNSIDEFIRKMTEIKKFRYLDPDTFEVLGEDECTEAHARRHAYSCDVIMEEVK